MGLQTCTSYCTDKEIARPATSCAGTEDKRKTLVDPEATLYYHCIGRCVRRAWLWGEDRVFGRNYEHRKNWVTARVVELAEVFTLEVFAYAVMSNHYHLVVRLDVEKAYALSDDEVIARVLLGRMKIGGTLSGYSYRVVWRLCGPEMSVGQTARWLDRLKFAELRTQVIFRFVAARGLRRF